MKSVEITGLTNGQQYGIRIFPRNPKGQCQTRNDRGTALVTPSNRDPNTVLLLHFDNNVNDASSNNFSITNSGLSFESSGKFGNAISLNSTTQHLTLPVSSNLEFGSNDFTFDWWEKTISAPVSGGCLFAMTGLNASQPILVAYENALYASSNNTDWNLVAGAAMKDRTNGVWVHWALVRNGTSIKSYKNGTLFWSGTINGALAPRPTTSPNPMMNRYRDHIGYNAQIDEFRISNIARWTANFTPPTAPYER